MKRAVLGCLASWLAACGGDSAPASVHAGDGAISAEAGTSSSTDAGAHDVLDAAADAAPSNEDAAPADAATGTIQIHGDALAGFAALTLPTPLATGGHHPADTTAEPASLEKSEVSFETQTAPGVSPAFAISFRYVALQYQTLPTGLTTDESPGDVAVALEIKRAVGSDFGQLAGDWVCCTHQLCDGHHGTYSIEVTSVDAFAPSGDAGWDHGFSAHGTLHAECPPAGLEADAGTQDIVTVDITF